MGYLSGRPNSNDPSDGEVDDVFLRLHYGEKLCPRCKRRPRQMLCHDPGDGRTVTTLAKWCSECLGTP